MTGEMSHSDAEVDPLTRRNRLSYTALRRARQALVVRTFEAGIDLHARPNDPEAFQAFEDAERDLHAWDHAHATEYNQLKPWFEARAKTGE